MRRSPTTARPCAAGSCPPPARDTPTSPSDETRGEQRAAGLGHDDAVHHLALLRNQITASSQHVCRLGEGALLQPNTERATACQFVFGDASAGTL